MKLNGKKKIGMCRVRGHARGHVIVFLGAANEIVKCHKVAHFSIIKRPSGGGGVKENQEKQQHQFVKQERAPFGRCRR